MDEFPSEIFSDDANHKFCFVYWEHGPDSSTTSIYYLDTPDPLDASVPRYTFSTRGNLNELNVQLRTFGWQVYHIEGDQESYRSYLIRLPDLESQSEHSLLLSSVVIDNDQHEKPPVLGSLFRLGENNTSLITMSMRQLNYDQIVEYLARERWAFSYEEDCPKFEALTKHHWRLRFYKRLR